jgi:voltage-gated sodium channel
MPFIPMKGSIAALRLLRLARLIKLVNKIRNLRMLLQGLIAGLGQMGYISVLMFLIFYLFAVMGVLLFRNNDPFHWENLGQAMCTLFRYRPCLSASASFICCFGKYAFVHTCF